MLDEITKKLVEFRDKRDWKQFHTPEALAKSVSIEAAELLECFQWSCDYEDEEVREELADVFIYAILMAESLGLDIKDIINKKIEKNGKKYPVSKAKGSSKKADKL